jgi:hypothetical protein
MPPSPSWFYDPATTTIPQGTQSAPVTWNAFPGRLEQYYLAVPPVPPAGPYNFTKSDLYQLADTGYLPSGESFPPIPKVICPEADWSPEAGTKTFGPYGPRGWLDEYCEWSAARDASGNLIRIDFACENPEYYNTLWKVSPAKVVEIYNQTLNFGAPASQAVTVTLADLSLFLDGAPVIDPETNRPVYNPLNKWNSGPVSVRTGGTLSGGAMHLTSTPNTLQTELGLAASATVQYQPPGGTGNSDAQALICCGNYGQEYRNSDPTIGQTVNKIVGGQFITGQNFLVNLANPVGLYIQPLTNPGAFTFGPAIDPSKLPAGAAASDVWQIVRGAASVTDPVTSQPFPGGMILHVACQIPAGWLAVYPDITLADILINGTKIEWAGQVAEQFQMGLYARPLATSNKPPPADCASTATVPGTPLQTLFFKTVWDGYYNNIETAPTGQKMSLASNSTFIAPQLTPNGQSQEMVLTCVTPSGRPEVVILLPDGSAPDPYFNTVLTGMAAINNYAVPGNSFPPNTPNAYSALSVLVTVRAGAPSGLRPVQVTDPTAGKLILPASLYVRAV